MLEVSFEKLKLSFAVPHNAITFWLDI